jgi:hypothetical protein
LLVVETLLGLQEEGRVRVVDGRAELIDGRLPRRVHEKMRERLGRLSDDASDAVTIAASLGRTFSFDELARTLGRPASEMVTPVGSSSRRTCSSNGTRSSPSGTRSRARPCVPACP